MSGIGVGQSAFEEVYPDYALSGIESAPHAHSLFAQILTELGIFGLVVFLLLLLMLFRSAFTLFDRKGMKNKYSHATLALCCGVFALLVNGLTDYIWYNYRIYLCFWIMIGLITAVRRRSAYDDFVFTGDPYAFDLDITVSGRPKKNKRSGKGKNEVHPSDDADNVG